MMLKDSIQGRSFRFDTKHSQPQRSAAGARAKRQKKPPNGHASLRRAEQGSGSQGLCAVFQTRDLRRPAALADSSDDALISAIAEGDHHAMRELFARHSTRVYRFVLRITGRAPLAEDLVNEIFLAVWRQADKFESRSQVSTWLLGIARFKAISALRQRSHEELDLDAMAQLEDPADGPETTLEKADRFSLLREYVTRLSPAQREVVDLVYYHDRSVAEVSKITGVPKATVKTRMFYARKKLAEFLQQAETSRVPAEC